MKSRKALISGWGRYKYEETEIITPVTVDTLKKDLQDIPSVTPRGLGRSYGDSAVGALIAQTKHLDHFLDLDLKNGFIRAQAGLSLREILRVIVKWGWFLPVTPGTSFVTLGGAIASDVHGKNHHLKGTFGDHIVSIKILLGTGEVVTTSPKILPELFHATCGGMGLTGIILEATIKLMPIESSDISHITLKSNSLDQTCDIFEEYADTTYSVAWVDCLTSGRHLGRGVLSFGEHASRGGLDVSFKHPNQIPVRAPSFLLNKFSVGAFNSVYYSKARHNHSNQVSLTSFFYPLDMISGWNALYGKQGLIQYQFVVPFKDGRMTVRRVLEEIAKSGTGSFLAVLKKFGRANNNLLSFPLDGYTLALDFKANNSNVCLIRRLDEIVAGNGGRVYLAKDALMTELRFKSMYPKWQEFETVREKYGALGKFGSSQSKRLGLG